MPTLSELIFISYIYPLSIFFATLFIIFNQLSANIYLSITNVSVTLSSHSSSFYHSFIYLSFLDQLIQSEQPNSIVLPTSIYPLLMSLSLYLFTVHIFIIHLSIYLFFLDKLIQSEQQNSVLLTIYIYLSLMCQSLYLVTAHIFIIHLSI